MAAPVVLVDPSPDALAALALVPPAAPPALAVPPASAAPPAPVAVVEGEQAAPALQAEVCSFEFSSPTFSLLVGQLFYAFIMFGVFDRCCLSLFGRLFDRILLVGRKFDCF